jgi:serine/threonine-protein kinase
MIAWERLEGLFEELSALPEADRTARLEELRAEDDELARELTSLVACVPHADDLFGQLPRAAAAIAAELVSSGGDRVADWTGGGWSDDHPGATIAQYRIEDVLGRGGMGVVYRATDTRLNRLVALKFLPPHRWVDRQARARLLLEARAVAALDHPNICTVHEVGETPEGVLFLAMPYYEGETLRERLTRGPLNTGAAADIAAQAARALAAAHARGIVHRDVKPANLMLTSTGSVKLLDFGLARLADATVTASGQTPGTIAYMSPEQVRGERADVRSDLWALGVVLFEMLTGERPFRGDSEAAVLHAILHQHLDVRRASAGGRAVPKAMARVVEQLLRKKPAERYQTANELLVDLSALGKGDAVPRRANSRWLQTPWTRRVRAQLAALVLTALVASALGVLSWRENASRREKSVAAVAEPRVASLAVLPLKNYSGDSTQEYFADGMTDELTSTLTKIEGLRVIAHQSVRQFKRSNRSVPEIARALGVTHVVDGSVLQAGGRVRITVNLIDAGRNAPIWSEAFERERRDILALQRDVALAIMRNVAVALTPQDRERLGDAQAVDPEAFAHYLKGTTARYYVTSEGWRDVRVAADHFERAIAADSAYAPAYAGLASVYAFAGDAARARELAERAIAMDPKLAEAHVVLGVIRQFEDWDWAGSDSAFRQAIRLDPGYPEAHHELSMLLVRRKRVDEAIAASQRALYLAPGSARFQSGLAEVYYNGGRYADAVRAAGDAQLLDPSWIVAVGVQAAAYGQLGKYEEAAAGLTKVTEQAGGDVCFGELGWVYARSGQRERALDFRRACEAGSRKHGRLDPAWAYAIAQVHAGMGNREQALKWLERAAEAGHRLLYLAVDPTLVSLHAEPRFRALLTKVGLAE